MTDPITSDVPLGLPKEPNPEREAWLKRIKSEWCNIEPENLEALTKLATDPNLEGIFLGDINRVVKHDDHVVLTNFHAGLSAYLEAINLAHKAKSGAGKSYITTETIGYFPEEDVVIIGSQSPKVVSHDYGELMTVNSNGEEEPLNLEDAPNKPMRKDYDSKEELAEAYESYRTKKKLWDEKLKRSFHLIRLTGKIYVFLDTIQEKTFDMFKMTMSHDKPRIAHRYVDEQGKVHTTILEGAAAFIFCTIDKEFLEEFATRTFTDTPETTKEKIGAAQEVTDNKRAYPWEYEEDTQEKKLIKALIRNIRDVIKEYNLKAVQPFPNLRRIIKFSSEATRDMRDYDHFTQILPTYAEFKLFQRPIITFGKQKYIVTTIDDVLAAKQLFDEIAETTRTSTEKPILDFYHKHVQHHKNGATLKVLLENAPEMRSERTARHYLNRLEELGWVNIVEGQQADKRLHTYYPLHEETDLQQELNPTAANPQNTTDLRLKLEEDFNSWLTNNYNKNASIQIEKIQFGTYTLQPITMEELRNIVCKQTFSSVPTEESKKIIGVDKSLLHLFVNEELSPVAENKPETMSKPEITAVQPISVQNGELGINGYTQKKGLVIFRKLAPNEVRQCFNAPYCVLEAAYEVHDPAQKEPYFFCEEDWVKARRHYVDNGYVVESEEENQR